jgi:hypothetical protein
MHGTLLILFALNIGWAANFPIDTTIGIPNQVLPYDSIPVRIASLDTDLVFFTTPGTASCPGYYSGDIKNVKKVSTQDNPNPNQNYYLWSAVATCGSGPNSYSAQNTYYEYEFIHRGKTLYLNFTKFTGPGSFPTGTFPAITFQINIDTASHMHTAPVKRKRSMVVARHSSTPRFDLKGRHASPLQRGFMQFNRRGQEP